MPAFEICARHCHRLLRPLNIFNIIMNFRSSRHSYHLPDKQFTSFISKNAVNHSCGIINAVLQLIPVSLFVQPAKMVWVTVYDKVFILKDKLFLSIVLLCVAVIFFFLIFHFLLHVHHCLITLDRCTK